MPFKREKPLPSAETPAEPERTPEYSRETLNMIESLDNGLADSENLLSGLGRLAREQIITDPKELEEIYAPKQIGKLGLEKYDASIFEAAGRGLRIRNAINLGQYKYALRGEEGMVVDTRKLKEEAEGEKFKLNADELKKIKKRAEKFGLNPEEINPQNLKTTFIEGEQGAEKIVLRKKTEQEADQLAGDILERRLKELETKTGADLVKQKQSLEELIKEKETIRKYLDEADMAEVEKKEIDQQKLTKQNQENLNSELEIFMRPLWEHRRELAGALSNFSFLLEDLTDQEKVYKQEINGLQTKISKIKGTKQIREILGDDIKDWEEEKKQAEANLKIVREKKADLNKRINELKKSQAEVNAVLTRINNIGKTKAEQRSEKEAEKEQKRREKGQQRPEDIKKEKAKTAPVLGQLSEEEARRWQDIYKELEENKVAQPPRPKIDDDNNPPSPPEEIKPEQREKNIRTTGDWLFLLKIQSNTPTKKNLIEKYFVVGDKKFNAAASMTVAEVRRACIGFYGEAEGLKANLAKKKFEKKLYDIRTIKIIK